jgi:hypothetical protein
MSATESSRPAAPVIVLGMHRSGTSFAASVVGVWGINMGDRLLPAASDNPRGFFEDRDFLDFHVQVLNRVLTPLFPGDALGNFYRSEESPITLSSAERVLAAALVERRRDGGPWGWKDPRTCLLLDFWARELPAATLVAVYRHPLEVYGSIMRRHGAPMLLDEPALIDTWSAYNAAILRVWRTHTGPKILLGAGGLFGRTAELVNVLEDVLGPIPPGGGDRLPRFHAEEFQRWPVTAKAHECFGRVFPRAAGLFDELQRLAAVPLEAMEQEPADWTGWETISDGLGAEARALLLPMLACRLSPEFARTRSAQRGEGTLQALRTEAEVLRMQDEARRSAAVQVVLNDERNQAVTSMATLAGELTEWRAQFLAAAAARRKGVRRRIYLWGANALGERVAALLEKAGLAVAGVIDRAGGRALTPATALAQLETERAGSARPLILVCSRTARDQIVDELAHQGWRAPRSVVALPDDAAPGGGRSTS